ncbi:amino acid transporter [Pilimelia terevasa]|uniref:Amino acid transporter n=1 Tax=Pilimelia terevasa TaxID=53372 RepID=A0A8J3FGF7_9ACTN|nr:APC family permease [Pilimelia terevasa]GGK21961.1 amino acid transporter [Pilimelia terevasa]
MGDDESIARFGYRQELRRTLGLGDLLVYGLIFMVPIAPFGIFGTVFSASGGMVALAYGVGMLAMILTANSYAQMVRAFPMAGSVYSYAGRGIAAPVGFLAGWAVLLDYVLVPCLLYLVAGVAMHAVLPAVPTVLWLVGFVLLNTVVNSFGIRLTAAVTRVFLVAEVVVLALFLAVGLWALSVGRGRGFDWGPVYDAATFSWPVVFAAVSVAMLSFLGFDGISMLAEENRGGARQIGRAMTAALLLAGALFIVQTWVASLLVPEPAALLAGGDPDGTAFYDAARVAGGAWLATLTAVATALAWGVANALVAQVATSRLLYAMARDRQLPRFLARVSVRHAVPTNAIVAVAAVSLGLGVYMARRPDGVALLSSLINFGAVLAFVVLHVSVVWHHRRGGRRPRFLTQVLLPLLGAGVLVAVAVHANVLAQRVGLAWLAVGVAVLAAMYATGRRPRLPGLSADRESR